MTPVHAAFNEQQVLKLTGLTPGRLHYWIESRVITPDLEATFAGGPRLYSFQDLISLRMLAKLRASNSLQALRRVGAFLATVSQKPWSRLRLFVNEKGGVHFRDPETGRVVSAAGPEGQVVDEVLLDLDEVTHSLTRDVERARKRPTKPAVTQRRGVLGSTPVIEGTRIPVALIQELHRSKYSVGRILEEYPALTPQDVRVALAYQIPPKRKRTA